MYAKRAKSAPRVVTLSANFHLTSYLLQNRPPKSRPTIEFRDLDVTISGEKKKKKKLGSSSATANSNAKKEDGSDSERSRAAQAAKNDRIIRVANGDQEGDEWLDESPEQIASAAAFDLDQNVVALDSPFLLDMLSEAPLIVESEHPRSVPREGKKDGGEDNNVVFAFHLDIA
ncbi:hypothetical protein BOTBODRAFT_173287 [Botryobasidium botryosum FD-172 SS1]|uniref:Uncharacterized protein n=1 Tax=Botryobasidium botryosum (strain FD-172 SS1) TaxID=930990 RepID=A0A067MVT5_BOTB1|nr:hypothetical protein BOTBODRAFT_173287 [Botryobasidium botryosum FD-172 SS1]